MHFVRAIGVVLAVLAVMPGCTEATGGKLPVSGTIKLKGQPIADGSIQFVSADAFTGAAIKDGKYEIPAAQGLVPGTYTVRISAPESSAPVSEPGGEIAPPVKDLVPAEYNTNSTLNFEAKPGNKTFDFDIP
jgi:hypothetical protein